MSQLHCLILYLRSFCWLDKGMFFCRTSLIISTVFEVSELYALKEKKNWKLAGFSLHIFYTVAIWIYREISGNKLILGYEYLPDFFNSVNKSILFKTFVILLRFSHYQLNPEHFWSDSVLLCVLAYDCGFYFIHWRK